MAELQEKGELKLLRLTPQDYKEYIAVGALCGMPLAELFPNQVYALFEGERIVEVAEGLTKRMWESGFNDN